jgi:hypothetical protein
MISNDDYLWFVDRTLDQMVVVLGQLSDEHACEKPELPGANSPYGIVTHCLGVMTSWAGHLVANREVVRDRDTEFSATGTVGELVAKLETVRHQFQADVAVAQLDEPLHFPVSPADADFPFGMRQGAALFHIYEELAQHLGQMEITRDILLSNG